MKRWNRRLSSLAAVGLLRSWAKILAKVFPVGYAGTFGDPTHGCH